jgi:hypothetical protein
MSEREEYSEWLIVQLSTVIGREIVNNGGTISKFGADEAAIAALDYLNFRKDDGYGHLKNGIVYGTFTRGGATQYERWRGSTDWREVAE